MASLNTTEGSLRMSLDSILSALGGQRYKPRWIAFPKTLLAVIRQDHQS
jgi:hypothetical protein